MERSLFLSLLAWHGNAKVGTESKCLLSRARRNPELIQTMRRENIPSIPYSDLCFDTTDGRRDSGNVSCQLYEMLFAECGQRDTTDFRAKEHCCACGGGTLCKDTEYVIYGANNDRECVAECPLGYRSDVRRQCIRLPESILDVNDDCGTLDELLDCPAESAPLGSDVTKVQCSKACGTRDIPTTYYATKDDSPTAPIYLMVASPPNWGSSALENLLASSPAVSTMCHLGDWQCEGAWPLRRNGFSQYDLYNPDPNWTAVYDVFERVGAWDNLSKPFRMEKSVETVGKSGSLVKFFEETNRDYRFVVLLRSACLHGAKFTHYDPRLWQTCARHLRETMHNVPDEKQVVVSYDTLLTHPEKVAKQLLDAMPGLKSLSINTYHLHQKTDGGGRSSTLYDFIHSEKCNVKIP